ncbi:site-specific integrase [Prescottella equi]|uniref:Tyrosine-type recombinase/integrase n=1 Tax=Rhodococcus hoagii TaxID=43767 RepID=A0A9Q2PC46_RHOHA|nr:site-specific integrase [Prescottella equi]MBM4487400.1 tyrosine-type recombinase/integrase [Prescottella equi]MBM4497588.1 tyrosine-type recombinase/integrase [Prescottella equi]MBM4554326.1 tyrosine-type recombinase/integrase [Prescottella equi]MBM4558254.1 tyrosine-type recombinase/integrase [Prescottella equi]MBM4567471.1 tyrosine-type recombinase/integrase [Prescottella equi]
MAVQKRERGGRIRWVGRYRGSDGIERSQTFDTRGAAKDWVNDRERELRRGEWINPKDQEVTVGKMWADWEAAAKTDGTRKVRELVGRNLGRLERAPIGAVKASDVRLWKRHLEEGRPWVPGCTGLKPNTVDGWCGQLAGFFNMLVADNLLLKSPAAGIGKRRKQQTGVRAIARAELITADEVWRIEEAARVGVPKGRNWVAPYPTFARMIIVGAATGLRGGEIAGVRIRAVDFLRREMTITEQSKTGTSAFEWAPLKTAAAHRVLPLSDMALEAIAEELAENPCADRSMPVFRTMHGRMWSSSTVSHSFRAVRNRLGLDPAITWHSLRHFYASALIHAGASPKTVQERLGHESAETTLEVYTHLWPGEGERTRSAVDAALMRDQCGTGSSSDAESDETVPAELDSTGTGE